MKFDKMSFPILYYLDQKKLGEYSIDDNYSEEIRRTTDVKRLNEMNLSLKKFMKQFTGSSVPIYFLNPALQMAVSLHGNSLVNQINNLRSSKGIILEKREQSGQSIFFSYDGDTEVFEFMVLDGLTIISYGSLESDLATSGSEKVEVFYDIIPTYSLEETNENTVMGIAFGYVGLQTLLFLENFKTEISLLSQARSFKRKQNLDEEEYTTQFNLIIKLVQSAEFKSLIDSGVLEREGKFIKLPGPDNLSGKLTWHYE